MTPEHVPADFEQTMGCTSADLLRCLPLALQGGRLEMSAAGGWALATFSDGSLRLQWSRLADRRIALLEIPRLQVRFQYSGLSAERRPEVQRRFDLATQRGGG